MSAEVFSASAELIDVTCHYCACLVEVADFENSHELTSAVCPGCGRTLTMSVRTLDRLTHPVRSGR
jgi:hypothetical protein